MPPKTTATKSVTYSGGLDAVVIHLPSGAVEFPRGTPVEVSAEDASVLSNNPDFTPAPTKATTTTTKPSEEDA
jgi:hypothetical protein